MLRAFPFISWVSIATNSGDCCKADTRLFKSGLSSAGAFTSFKGLPMADDNIPGQYGIESYIPMPEEVGAAMQQGITPAMAQTPAMQQSVPQTPSMNPNVSSKPIPMQNSAGAVMQGNFQNTPSQTNRPENRSMQTQAGGIRKDMPLEQIYSMLNRDIAAGVVVPVGFNKGKTLGQVAMEKPDSLEWYVTSYGGPDNLLRAAAKFLLDMALAQAS